MKKIMIGFTLFASVNLMAASDFKTTCEEISSQHKDLESLYVGSTSTDADVRGSYTRHECYIMNDGDGKPAHGSLLADISDLAKSCLNSEKKSALRSIGNNYGWGLTVICDIVD